MHPATNCLLVKEVRIEVTIILKIVLSFDHI